MGKKFKAEYFQNKRDLVERAVRNAIQQEESYVYSLKDNPFANISGAVARIRDYTEYLRSRNMTP